MQEKYPINGSLIGISIAILLMSSWLVSYFRQIWDATDLSAFLFLNGTLIHKFPGAWFWAIANHRAIDLPMFFFLFLLPLLSIVVLPTALQRKKRLAQFLFAFLYLVTMIFLTRNTIRYILAYAHWHREGPSLLFDTAVRLSHLFPYMNIKDASSDSFPGDHTTVLLVWFGFVMIYAGKRYFLYSFLVVVFFSLPRLVAGAHWLSDEIVGSGAIASLIVSGAWIGFFQQKAVAAIESWLGNPSVSRCIPFISLHEEN